VVGWKGEDSKKGRSHGWGRKKSTFKDAVRNEKITSVEARLVRPRPQKLIEIGSRRNEKKKRIGRLKGNEFSAKKPEGHHE